MAKPYYQCTVGEVEALLGTDIVGGLSTEKARQSLGKFGCNSLSGIKSTSFLAVLLRQFKNFFLILLLGAATISYFVDGPLQAGVIFVIVVINVFFGFFQEYKAERALQDLKNSFKAESKVVRGGKIQIIPSEELTLGDIVILETGDRVPADARMVEGESLRAEESILTGESLPIGKFVEPIDGTVALADQRNMVFAGTTVAAGRGKTVVVAVGKQTEFGRIAKMIEGSEETTPLEKEIVYLSRILTAIALGVALLIFLLGLWRNYEIWPLLTLSIALLVSVVPESLPTVITLSLAIGTSQMAKKKAIVRRLGVIEALGTVDVIATDKTGTLTDNKLSVNMVSVFSTGSVGRHNLEKLDEKNTNPQIKQLLIQGLLCSNVEVGDKGQLLGDPLEVAIAKSVEKVARGRLSDVKAAKRLMEAPFDSNQKFMAVLIKQAGGGTQLIAKGAPERIIGFCQMSLAAKKYVLEEAKELSEMGLRVIAVARSKQAKMEFKEMELVGLIGLVDEPSRGVAEAIAKTVAAGIRPLIITGDHLETARFVASKIGITIAEDEALTGEDLSRMSRDELVEVLKDLKLVARATPEDKIRVVETLQKMGYSVAVTGDGINDAPALKEASVGIAMGIKGTDVARDAADVVLSDDKYTTIVAAILYGRSIYDNIRHAMIFLLSGNLDELLLIIIGFIFGLPLPLVTLQILWINLVTESLPAISFAFEKPSMKLLRERPRPSQTNSIRVPVINALVLAAVAFIFGFPLYIFGLGQSVEKARTLIFIFTVLAALAYAFSLRTRHTIWRDPIEFFKNKFTLGAITLSLAIQFIIFQPPLSSIFSIVPLTGMEIIVLAVSTIFVFICSEIIKSMRVRQEGVAIAASRVGVQ